MGINELKQLLAIEGSEGPDTDAISNGDYGELLNILETTDSSVVRNAIAVFLGEAGYDEATGSLMELIFRPDLRNTRGSLIYALRNLSLSKSDIIRLLPLIYEGNYEVRHVTAELVKDNMKQLDNNDIVSCLVTLQKQISEYEDMLDTMEDIKETLIEHLV